MTEPKKETTNNIWFAYRWNQANFSRLFFPEQELFKNKWGAGRGLKEKRKESFLTVLAMVNKKGPTRSVKKYTNELKVH